VGWGQRQGAAVVLLGPCCSSRLSIPCACVCACVCVCVCVFVFLCVFVCVLEFSRMHVNARHARTRERTHKNEKT
jgi:hypothetical protein